MFRTNAMLTINGFTLNNAVYGRAAHLLPDLNVLPDKDTYDCTHDVPLRDVHRLREVAIQSIMAETAKARLSRALNSKVGIAGQRLNFKPGDHVVSNTVPFQTTKALDLPGSSCF